MSDIVYSLQDINFEINQGDAVGIIGRNGAGKSTLLKILSRVTTPTTGKINIKGRVASLLEVGTGFHPELTGRENIYLNGAILGMRKREIDRKLDEIIDFSGVERYIDTPVKRYSSGMYVRLAFAVAAHLESEILIVDEVLAVGDAEFQKKCLGKMGEVSKGEGRTVLFVSHNMGAVKQLTQKSIMLNRGQLVKYGDTNQIINDYSKNTFDSNNIIYEGNNLFRLDKELQKEIEFISLKFADKPNNLFEINDKIKIEIEIFTAVIIEKFRISYTIFTNDGNPIGSGFSLEINSPKVGEKSNFLLTLSELSLSQGNYYFGIALGFGNNEVGHRDFDIVQNVLHFEIIPKSSDKLSISSWHSGWGAINFEKIELTKI
jgi:lipopolysaccharide transport system ATP-binding protein